MRQRIYWKDQVVLITGAGHGLGRALSLTMAQMGATLVVTNREISKAQETVDLILQSGGKAIGLFLDVSKVESIREAREQISQKVGEVSVLINNAGVVSGGEFTKVDLDSHLRTLDINLKGLIQTTHFFLPEMLKRSKAVLINIASASSLLALPWASTYAASKWGVLGFSDSLREELKLLKQSHCQVISVCPSYISTGMFQGVKLPWLMRWVSPENLANRIVRAIEKHETTVLTPWNVIPVPLAKALLPHSWFLTLCRWLGVTKSMVSWQGHTR